VRRAPQVSSLAVLVLVASAGLEVPTPLAASAPFDFYARGPYRTGVPRPAEVLGYEPGTFHTSYGNMERYVDALIHAAADRVVREPYGRTYEFRERALLIITSPENQRRLETIRAATAKLADPRTLANAAEAERLIRDTPATVWLNYSIHGDESASFEAMMQVAYQLAAGEDSTTRAVLERCVVVMNLAHNPDGHERFVTWINALGQGNPDPWAIEQQRQQPWGIGGRTNHYQLDLNRDALAMSQVESRQMGQAIRRWNPQVFVDHHGQTASYFFAPPAAPINPELPAAEVMKWTDVFGRANAAAFDRYGWSYYVRDVFDLYYPGYWDSGPSLRGATGMTYETDGGGNLAIRRDDETVVTMLDGMRRHFVASLATCATAAEHRAERLRDYHRFQLAAIEEGRRGPVRAYAVDPGRDPVRAAALVENLLHAGVEVRWVAGPVRSAAARPVWIDALSGRSSGSTGTSARPGAKPAAKSGGASATSGPPPRVGTPRGPDTPLSPHEFSGGAFVVDLGQPAGRLARTLIERDAPVDSAFARAQLDKYDRNLKRGKRAPKEGYDFYDITAWSLPIAYGVQAFALRDVPAGGVSLAAPDPARPEAGAEALSDSLAVGVPMPARASRSGPPALVGADGRVVRDLGGRIEGGRATTAYVWSCVQDGAVRLALRLMQEDFKVATTVKPLRAGGHDFPRGSFLARIERNPEALHERIAELARTSGVTVTAAHTAYADRGDTGVGSEAVASLKRPRVAVLVDGSVSPTSYGWLWFLFERRLGVRFTALRVSAWAGAELERYNVVVIPDGSPSGLARALGEGGISALKDWVSRGGTLVCLDDAAELPTLPSVGLSSARAVGVKAGEEKKDEADDKAPSDSVREEERRPEYVPGTVFWASLDPRHFLAYGFDASRIPVLLQGRLFLKPSKEGANPLTFDREPLALTGWTWPETERRLKGTAFAVDEPTGDGHVIMIEGSPVFRLFWRSTERLLLNAVVYGPTLD
jgi:zinc carboxypeptidase